LWNAALFVCMCVFAALATTNLVDGLRRGWYAGSAVMGGIAAWAGVGMVRALLIGVWVDDRRIAIRGPFWTTVIPWEEVVEIQRHHPMASGVAGLVGATSPAVVRRRKGKPDRRVELRVIGTYELTRRGRSLGERTIEGLTWHWERWKASNVAV